MVATAKAKPEPLPCWIERVIQLPPGAAAVPGPIRLYPYQRGIAAATGRRAAGEGGAAPYCRSWRTPD